MLQIVPPAVCLLIEISRVHDAERAADLRLLADQAVMARLAPHITRFQLHSTWCSGPQATVTSDIFIHLCKLQHLRHLELLCGNSLHWLPPQIGQLCHLESLTLSCPGVHHGLSLLPQPLQLAQLLALTQLNLHTAQDCMETVCMLPSLRELHLGACAGSLPPCSLPAKVVGLSQLSWLHLRGRSLGGSLDSLSKLTALQHFIIEGVAPGPTFSIANFSQGLAGLTSLNWLAVSGSTLTLPIKALTHLSSLICLELEACQFTSFECSGCWQQLRILSLNDCCLDCMPSNLSVLHALTKLILSNQRSQNFQLEAPLRFIECMPFLCELHICQHRISHSWSYASIVFLAEADQYLDQTQNGIGRKRVSF